MSQDLLEDARQVCTEFCEKLRDDILRGNPGIQQEDFSMLYLPQWLERFNAAMRFLAPRLPQSVLQVLCKELSVIGGKYLMLKWPSDEQQSNADSRGPVAEGAS